LRKPTIVSNGEKGLVAKGDKRYKMESWLY